MRAPAVGSAVQTYLPLATPNAFGNSRYVDYWGRENTNEDASGFVGTGLLLADFAQVKATAERLPYVAGFAV